MANEIVENIMAALKDAGLDLEDEVAEAARRNLGSMLELVPLDKGLGEGEIAVDEKKYRERGQDLVKLRKRLHDAEDERDKLKNILDAGESRLAKENEVLTTKVQKMEPLLTQFLDGARKEWEKVSPAIPKELQERFTWAQSETEALADSEIMTNLERYKEYKELGVPGIAGELEPKEGAPDQPKGPPGGKPPPGTGLVTEGKTSAQLLEEGYAKKEGGKS